MNKTPAIFTGSDIVTCMRYLLIILVAAIFVFGSQAYSAESRSTHYRISEGYDKFNNTRQIAFAFEFQNSQFFRSDHFELAIGSVSAFSDNEAFLSFGPVWRIPIGNQRIFAEVGFAPTLFSGSKIEGREIGGLFHFTSSASVGAVFGDTRRFTARLRIQHTSNGGLGITNPGMDMIGLDFIFRFDQSSNSAR